MSEPTLAELAALGAPLLKAGEQALAPEAEKVLTDLRGLVAGEMDRLRTELPAVVEQGTAHLHNLGEALLSRYHAIMGHIDSLLTGATPANPPAAPLPAEAQPVAPVIVGERGPEAPLSAADPTPAPSTDAGASSTPSSTPSATAPTADGADTPN